MTQVADVFSNRYEVQRSIARGGMAEVFLARDQLLDRPVALKVLSPEFARDQSFVERFRREAQSAAALNHPNIVAIYDWGQEHGTSFIVMEYVHGRTLREVLQAHGPLKPRQTAQIGADIAAALFFAHRNGIVHRDIKPGNVLLTADREVKVADFGIARADTSEALTQTGAVMGTATYFSPEQAQGFPCDGRSDIYSLGVVLYEMLTGSPPFVGDSPVAVAYKHVREEPTPPSARAAGALPPDLERIILTALVKEPDGRYQSADAMRVDLLRFTRGEAPVSIPVSGVITDLTAATSAARPRPAAAAAAGAAAGAAGATTRVAPTVPAGNGRGRARGGRRRTGTIVASLLGLAALVAAIVALIITTDTGGDNSGASTFVEVPDVINQSFNDAKTTLEAEGFEVSRREDEDSSQPPDIVLDQDPPAGDNLEKGRTVRLTVSSPTFQMPELVGKQRADAINELLRRGLTNTAVNVEIQEEDSDQPVGAVLRTDPAAGAEVQKADGHVILVVAREPPIAIPDVTGQPAPTAQQILSQAGFQVTTASEPSDTVPADRVTRTEPAAGATAPRGSSITIFISTGPQDLVVPEVRNLPEAQATQTLQGAGFQVARAEQAVSSPLQNGVVVATNPNPGERRPPQSFVTITVGRFTVTGPTTTTR